MSRQSDLSLATGVFYLAGGVFSYLTFTLFNIEDPPRNPVLLVGGALAFLGAAVALIRGSRLTQLTAAVMMTSTALAVLYLAVSTLTELRAINSGLLFFTIFMYLIWFMPRWFARLLGYTWLAVYTVSVLTRFSGEIELPLATLVATMVAIGELIGRFKSGLEAATLTDPLCSVWNRRGFQMVLDRAAAAAERTGGPVSVLFIDLDGFKAINDRHGHAEGDRVLRQFAQAIGEATRPQDTLARLGGDEFAILLPDTDVVEARRLGDRLRSHVTLVEWSVGAAQLLAGESGAAFVARADELMLVEKRARKAARIATPESGS